MKRKQTRKKYRPVKVFMGTFFVCILLAATAGGIAVVYVRTEQLRSGEAKPAFSVVAGENGTFDVTVLGKESKLLLPPGKKLTALEYSLIPPEVRTLWQGALYLSEELFPERGANSEEPDNEPADIP